MRLYQLTFADGEVILKRFKDEYKAVKWGVYYSFSRFRKLEFHIKEHNNIWEMN